MTQAMRSNVLVMARGAFRLTADNTEAFQRVARICPACRRASQRKSLVTKTPSSQRSFSQTLTNRRNQASADGSSLKSQAREAASQTHYDLFPETFPGGPPPNSAFTPDLKKLRREFLQLQAKAHPDLAPAERKKQAEALSAGINEAYKTLQDPLRRAQYLLSLAEIDVEDEALRMSDNALLMEVMEAREAVEEVESEEMLDVLDRENQERISQSVRTLENSFGEKDLDVAAHEAIKLRYWKNIEESIQGWERGKGGGILHH